MLALLPLVLSLAPEIARWISGSKAELVTQKAVEVVQAVTGTTDPARAAEVVQADPQKSLELRVALAKIDSEMLAIESAERIETLRADMADVANARQQTVTLSQEHSAISWAAPAISVLVAVGFFTFPFVSKYLGAFNDQIWLGALISAFTSVISYWLGSSNSSRKAQETLQSVASKSADTVNANASRPPAPAPIPTPAPPVVVVPQPVPPVLEPPPAPVPAPSVDWKQGPHGGARWQMTQDGVLIEGESAPGRTVGEPSTVRTIWANYGELIKKICAHYAVPMELVVACIATESRGKPKASLTEPDGRQSLGLMQILTGTASEVMGRQIEPKELLDPAINIEAGTRYILNQYNKTNFQPPLVAAAYNAGGLYPLREKDANRWNLRSTGNHIDRFVLYFNDASFVAKTDRW